MRNFDLFTHICAVICGWMLGLLLGFCIWWHPGTDAAKALNSPAAKCGANELVVHYELYDEGGPLNSYDGCVLWPQRPRDVVKRQTYATDAS